MLNTYITNQGTTKTIIHDNNHKQMNQIKWDADYDGDVAHISVNTNANGKRKHFEISLDNEDLANILNIQSVNMPIDKRLQMDFQEPYYKSEPYIIELPTPEFEPRQPRTIQEIANRHISTPFNGEELVIPLSIDGNKDLLNLITHKKHKHHKTHKRHKVHKKKSRPKSKRSKSRSTSRKTIPIIDLI
jgi:hypothetical protein